MSLHNSNTNRNNYSKRKNPADEKEKPRRSSFNCQRQKRKIVTIVVVVVFIFMFYFSFVYDWSSTSPTSDTVPTPTGFIRKNISACKFVEPKFANDNDGRKFQDESVGIRSKTIFFNSVSLFYRELQPRKGVEYRGDVLLLHGKAFSSQVWVDLGTMQLLANSGYRAVAIDQPGFNRKTNGSYDALTFLHALSTKLSLISPAVVSPSASGRFSVPYVVADHAGAFVPVAPCCTNQYSSEVWQNMTIPTLIIHGVDDASPASKFLLATPNHVFHSTKAGHSVYMDQPQLFHSLLLNFFNYLTQRPRISDVVSKC